MTQPLISVIVPCYNVEEYLPQCIESILNQTYRNLEILLVDDGSPDNCGKICDAYAGRDSRISVIHKENGGLVSARNAGYNAATGDWIVYVDSDDWIDLDTYKQIVSKLDKYDDVDLVFWKGIEEGGISNKRKSGWSCSEEEHLYLEEECIELSRNTLLYNSGVSSPCFIMVRSEFAHKYDIFHNPLLRQGSEGLDYTLRAHYYSKKSLYINAYFYHYRYNCNSISKKVDEKNTEYLKECYLSIENHISKFNRREEFMLALYQRVAYVMVAIAVGTYFHPTNNELLSVKIRKFEKVINETPLFKTSIAKCNTKGMDNKRKLTLLLIRFRMYFMLPVIAWLKQYFLKRVNCNH